MLPKRAGGIPTFKSSRFDSEINIVSPDTQSIFPALLLAEQKDFVEKLKAFSAEVEAHGDDPNYLKTLGVTTPDPAVGKAAVLDTCDWQLSTCLRYSTPSRISEAVPYLERSIAYHTRNNPDKVDETPEMYLGVALHKLPGQEEAAISRFRRAYGAAPHIEMQHHTQLWSRACYSRLLRRLGRVEEAKAQEKAIRNWILGHPYAMPPSECRALILDPEHEGQDYILDHPQIQSFFQNTREVGPGMVMHIG
ncbi:hypothetical protein R3P38DRAFT_3305901 [Favolaschia claudopus]|uniref:Uncharacterized protein n=1 Tax=Favolaschia claudopus TaxID=2862362 RepID=A0AAW0DL84_9AGAR